MIHSVAFGFITVVFCSLTAPASDDWQQFRGRGSTGLFASSRSLAIDPQRDRQWDVELPGPGSSSPIVVGERVFLTAYSGYGLNVQTPGDPRELRRHALCYDRINGRLLWERIVPAVDGEDPYQGFISEHGYASSTPASDGRIVVFFFGKAGVHAFDLDGKRLWQAHLGSESDPMHWGDGSSPIFHGDRVLLNAGNVARSVVALDKQTGKEIWRTTHPDYKNSWATPLLVQASGRDEIVLPFPGRIEGFDPANGQVLWHADSPMKDSIYGTLVDCQGVVLAMGGRNQAAIAVRCGGDGDVSASHVVWTTRLQSSIGTPLLQENHLYWASQGKALCASCTDGKLVFKEALPGSAQGHTFDYASPVANGRQILVLFKTGRAAVFAANTDFQQLSEFVIAEPDGRFNATPALSDSQMFVRSDRRLYAFQLPDENSAK